jgi:hypothetical protein
VKPQPFAEPLSQHRQRASQAELIERLRSQLDRDTPHALEARGHYVLHGEDVVLQLLARSSLHP